jgi:hypothetical protein
VTPLASVVTDGTRTVYAGGPRGMSLYYSPAQGQPAHKILSVRGNGGLINLAVGPGWLAWSGPVNQGGPAYLASTKSGAYTRVSPHAAVVVPDGVKAVLTGEYPYDRRTINPVYLAAPGAISWPACPRPR